MAQFDLVATASSQLWDFGWFDVSRFRVTHHTEATPTWQDRVRSFFADPVSQRRFCTSPDP